MIRGVALRVRSGDNPWAFAKATGIQRWTSSAFALSISASAGASALAAVRGDAHNWTASSSLVEVAGAIIVLVAQHQMGRAWRIGVREDDAPVFVSKGLFRISRNPVFVGMIMMGLGMALAANNWWSWCAWLAFMASCHFQVSIEERHLAVNFGEPYRDFKAKIPRWIGF